jgi:hypothetical protein
MPASKVKAKAIQRRPSYVFTAAGGTAPGQ